MATEFTHLINQKCREKAALILSPVAYNTTGCQRKWGKCTKYTTLAQSLTYVKQTQLVRSVKIGRKCSNSHGTSLSTPSLPKVTAKYSGGEGRFTEPRGPGGVKRD